MKTAILTDSSAVIDKQVATELGIKILPLPLKLGANVYYESKDISDGELFDLANSSKETLTIAPVSLEEISAQMAVLADEGYTDVICIHLANGLTNLNDSLRSYAKSKDSKLTVHLFDSYTIGLAQAHMVRYAGKLAQQGKTPAEILAALEALRDKSQTVVIDDIRNLKKTGYVSNGKLAMGNALLHLKTLLEFTDNGKLTVLDTRVRMKKVYQKVLEHIQAGQPENGNVRLMLMCDDGSAELANKWLAKFSKDLPQATLEIKRQKPSIRVHTGEKSLLLSWSY
ncbi:MAG: DegV family EDD domain-containing protein [Lactobacillus sp.]|nr:DegV family EDD domain-containing protein [Lactobacillus sp.]